MDFRYSPEQIALRDRAAALAADIMVHEEACEEANGLPPEITHRTPLAHAWRDYEHALATRIADAAITT